MTLAIQEQTPPSSVQLLLTEPAASHWHSEDIYRITKNSSNQKLQISPWQDGKLYQPVSQTSHLSPMTFAIHVQTPPSSVQVLFTEPSALQRHSEDNFKR